MLKTLICFIFLFPAFAFGETLYTGMCRIYREDGSVKAVFPGRQCIFLAEGKFISLGNSSLRGFSGEGRIEWEYQVPAETNLSLSSDAGRFFLSGPDRVTVLSTKGKVLQELRLSGTPAVVSEVPSLKKRSKHSWLRSGNILVGLPEKGILVYSRDLKKLLHTIVIENARRQMLVDFLVTREGTLVALIQQTLSTPVAAPSSALEEMNLENNKIIARYPEKPTGTFYLPASGSVNVLPDGNFLLSDSFSGVYRISRDGKKVLGFNPAFHFDSNGLRPPEKLSPL